MDKITPPTVTFKMQYGTTLRVLSLNNKAFQYEECASKWEVWQRALSYHVSLLYIGLHITSM